MCRGGIAPGTREVTRHTYNRAMDAAESPAPIIALLENHRAFLSYLERRVGDRALAEDILQEAFAKVVARPLTDAHGRSRDPVVLSHPSERSDRSVPAAWCC